MFEPETIRHLISVVEFSYIELLIVRVEQSDKGSKESSHAVLS